MTDDKRPIDLHARLDAYMEQMPGRYDVTDGEFIALTEQDLASVVGAVEAQVKIALDDQRPEDARYWGGLLAKLRGMRWAA